MMLKGKDIIDELEWMRKRYPNAKIFKTEKKLTEKKPINDRVFSNLPKFNRLTFDERFKEYLRQEEEEEQKKEKQKKEEYFRRKYMERCCNIIKEHHDRMKDDPEHLTTDFLLDITGCNCQKRIKDIFFTSTPKLDARCNLFWGILDTLNLGKVHPKKK
jgi:hypothetical protein